MAHLYFHFFVATLLYCVASLMASEAIDLHLYYTGSLFDVPLVAGMVWFVRIAFLPREDSISEFPRGSCKSAAMKSGKRVLPWWPFSSRP